MEFVIQINKYFVKVAIDIQSPMRFSKKIYIGDLLPLNVESFFITQTVSTDISSIVSTLSQDKSDGSNSIPCKILKLSILKAHLTRNTFKQFWYPLDAIKNSVV